MRRLRGFSRTLPRLSLIQENPPYLQHPSVKTKKMFKADKNVEQTMIKDVKRGDYNALKAHYEKGVNINAVDSDGRTSLMWASKGGDKFLVEKLLSWNADCNLVNSDGRTALMWAAKKGHIDIVRALIKAGANINAMSMAYETALMFASEFTHADIVKLLIAHGAKQDATDKDGMTALMKASQYGKDDALSKATTKIFNDELHKAVSYKDILQGRIQMYQLMLYPDVALAQFTEGYLNDCTDSFSKEHLFGKGAFGTIYLGQDKEDVRLKYMIQKAPIQLASKSDLASFHDIFQRDLAPLYLKRHSNLARLFGYTASEFSDVYLVKEFISNEPVLDILKTEEKRKAFPANRRIKVMYEVARALSFLHKGVVIDETNTITYVHRDIHLANVFFAEDRTVKLMECGLSKFVNDPSMDNTPTKISMTTTNANKRFGTPGYTCPSYVDGKIPYMPACDIYSFGIIMLELLTGCIQNGNLIGLYHEKSLVFDEFDRDAGVGWNHVLPDLSALALDCVKTEYSERPTTEEVFERLSDVYTRLVLTPATSPTK